jgi:hypothetical protein
MSRLRYYPKKDAGVACVTSQVTITPVDNPYSAAYSNMDFTGLPAVSTPTYGTVGCLSSAGDCYSPGRRTDDVFVRGINFGKPNEMTAFHLQVSLVAGHACINLRCAHPSPIRRITFLPGVAGLPDVLLPPDFPDDRVH